VSPIVGGAALKGPAAKIMEELGAGASATEVARHYARRGLLDGFVLDVRDAADRDAIEALDVAVQVTDTVMTSAEDRQRVARAALQLADAVRSDA
jgi:LPPG:FO 2-phospho-L-lactate transferase